MLLFSAEVPLLEPPPRHDTEAADSDVLKLLKRANKMVSTEAICKIYCLGLKQLSKASLEDALNCTLTG